MTRRRRILVVIGTRPDVVKLAPVIRRLRDDDRFETIVVNTGQHRDLTAPILEFFGVEPDHDLEIMRPDQSSAGITAEVLREISAVYAAREPEMVMVLGDTTSAFAAALAAFYMRIPVAHVEAGLRTDDRYNPFPEEMNRRLITQTASLHLAATEGNRERLIAELVDPGSVVVTGNPVIDALAAITGSEPVPEDESLILLTTHRRENFGDAQRNIFQAVRRIVEEHPDVRVVFPMHPNPEVSRAAALHLGTHPRITVTSPLPYIPFIRLMSRSRLIMTDSGGIQEEAPALGKPVVILRSTTERPETIAAGNGVLAGVLCEDIVRVTTELLRDPMLYERMSRPSYPYGSGDAARRIVEALIERL